MFGSGNYPLLDTEPQSDDIEALQTDTMRFLAILAICLMVIFALVQAIPMETKDQGIPIDDLQQKLKNLKERIIQLSSQEQTLRKVINEKKARLAQMKIDKQALSSELDDIRSQISKTDQERIEIENQIKKIKNKKGLAQSALERITSKIDRENEKLNDVEKKLRKIREVIKPAQPPKPRPVTPSPPKPPKGFVLQFKSADALMNLVSSNRVQFYAVLGKRVWELHIVSGRFKYKEFIGKIYPTASLAPRTVPESFRRAFRDGAAVAFGDNQVNFYVTLPDAVVREIERAQTGREGGTIIITSRSRVELIDD